jgi:hypothetical protein
MRTSRTLKLLFAVLTCALLWAALLWLLPASSVVRANPGTLFAAVGGSGTACSQDQPCGLQTALAQAVDGDIIYAGAGTYAAAATRS